MKKSGKNRVINSVLFITMVGLGIFASQFTTTQHAVAGGERIVNVPVIPTGSFKLQLDLQSGEATVTSDFPIPSLDAVVYHPEIERERIVVIPQVINQNDTILVDRLPMFSVFSTPLGTPPIDTKPTVIDSFIK